MQRNRGKTTEWERLKTSSKKTGDTKGTFHAKMSTIKDRNSKNLTETEEIMKIWQKYTDELNKKVLNDPDNHSGVITHLQPDILKCKVKWASGKHHSEQS